MSYPTVVATVLVIGLVHAAHHASAADAIPRFDIERICQAELKDGSAIGETLASCKADEQRARDELPVIWATRSRSDRAMCLRATSADGSPSYVELQTCLEMTVPVSPSR